jgi:hypothetical protein
MTVYLNTYETWEAYGGPEEGALFATAAILLSLAKQGKRIGISDLLSW